MAARCMKFLLSPAKRPTQLRDVAQTLPSYFSSHLAGHRGLSAIRTVISSVSAKAVKANVVPGTTLTVDGSIPTWEIRILYDGECPLCMREVNFLRSRDAQSGKVDFVDIADPEYSPERNAGLTFEEAMGEIHAILPDGCVVTKVEVFRRVYEAVGLGWVYWITTIPAVGKVADALYDIWAKYRLPLTSRPALVDIARQRANNLSCRKQTAQASTSDAP